MGIVKKIFESIRSEIALNEELTFANVVKDSYRHRCEVHQDGSLPTLGEIAEDVIDNYEGYEDVDVLTPQKLAAWQSVVAQELNRWGLEYRIEESFDRDSAIDLIKNCIPDHYNFAEMSDEELLEIINTSDALLAEKIEKNGDKWDILSADGSKVLGSYDTKKDALKRLRAIEYFKSQSESAK